MSSLAVTNQEPAREFLLREDKYFVIGDNRAADAGSVVKREGIMGRYLKISEVFDYATLPTVFQLAETR